jgi:hypothetical protein
LQKSTGSDGDKHIGDLEVKVKSAEIHIIEIAAKGKKILRDFECWIVQKLEGLGEMYADKVQTIGGLCSPMSMEEPSAWLSKEVAGLPNTFCGVNENFATIVIEGALTLASDSVDLHAVSVATSKGGADVLPVGSSVQKDARAVSKKWWCSFSYDYVLSVILTQQVEVLYYF